MAREKRATQGPASAPDSLLRVIPAVEELLNRPAMVSLGERVGRRFLAARVREVLAQLRHEIREGKGSGSISDLAPAVVEHRIERAVEAAAGYSLQPVINATGVILHTNLGRAPLSAQMLEHAAEIATQYSNLEFDLATASRGERDVHISGALSELLGAEAAIVVNNNAAAVLLTLNALAEGGEVIVSRGELIEIGGSFRIPEIMQKSGAILREVGTTNRTRISDYRRAVNENTRLLLRVHPSNFRIMGFTEKPALEELVALGREKSIPVFEDLGSGCLVSLAAQGIRDEVPAGHSLAAGADVISFSGDKLLGGPQAGVIAGKKEIVSRIRRNPLFRALRVDKLTYAILESTFLAYRQEQYHRVPTVRMIQMSAQEIEQRARQLIETVPSRREGLRLEVVDGESVIGGGSAPGDSIPTRLIAVTHATQGAAALGTKLLASHPPVIARVEADTVLLDLRTVLPHQEAVLAQALRALD
ncbi:MAG: L-seryl-tRNA(Sec) selenium transferase [Acidobacteria bacterium]|nr:L-seryl-tRNA(Sec) selenium transferase [Acidobacteriota bacterium]